MIKNNKSHLFIALTIIIVIFIVSASVLLLLSPYLKSNSDNNLIIDFYSSQKIEINEYLPVSDKLGRTFSIQGVEKGVFGYLEFDVSNESSNDDDFQVYITKNDNDNEIRGNYIKFFMTDEYDNPYGFFEKNKVVTYNDLSVLKDKPKSKELYSGKIKSGEKRKFKLRVWLSDSYVVLNNNSSFSFNVDVRSV